MTQLAEKDFFKTSDLILVATLCCDGYAVEMVDKSNPNRAVFYIHRNELFDDVLQLYFTHQLKVEPQAFAHALKELKTRLYHAG